MCVCCARIARLHVPWLCIGVLTAPGLLTMSSLPACCCCSCCCLCCAAARFDVLCVVRDIVDPVQDQRLAEFVVGSHARSHPDGAEDNQAAAQQVQAQDPDILPQDLLRKYITYAKQQIRPSLSSVSSCAWPVGRRHCCCCARKLRPR